MNITLSADILTLLAASLVAAAALGAIITHLIDETHHREGK